MSFTRRIYNMAEDNNELQGAREHLTEARKYAKYVREEETRALEIMGLQMLTALEYIIVYLQHKDE